MEEIKGERDNMSNICNNSDVDFGRDSKNNNHRTNGQSSSCLSNRASRKVSQVFTAGRIILWFINTGRLRHRPSEKLL